jgi:hypothetical protein
MTKQPTRLVFLCALLGFGMQAKAWSADDRVCTKHILAPGYPRLAWQAQVTGTVDVEVAADGSVRSAVGSGALNLLNHAAEENVRQWIFMFYCGRLQAKGSLRMSLGGPERRRAASAYGLV